jgi:hypothetical protein
MMGVLDGRIQKLSAKFFQLSLLISNDLIFIGAHSLAGKFGSPLVSEAGSLEYFELRDFSHFALILLVVEFEGHKVLLQRMPNDDLAFQDLLQLMNGK